MASQCHSILFEIWHLSAILPQLSALVLLEAQPQPDAAASLCSSCSSSSMLTPGKASLSLKHCKWRLEVLSWSRPQLHACRRLWHQSLSPVMPSLELLACLSSWHAQAEQADSAPANCLLPVITICWLCMCSPLSTEWPGDNILILTDAKLILFAAVYDFQYTNSDNCIFNKLVFLSWYALS